jgi:hypothetical protein
VWKSEEGEEGRKEEREGEREGERERKLLSIFLNSAIL